MPSKQVTQFVMILAVSNSLDIFHSLVKIFVYIANSHSEYLFYWFMLWLLNNSNFRPENLIHAKLLCSATPLPHMNGFWIKGIYLWQFFKLHLQVQLEKAVTYC